MQDSKRIYRELKRELKKHGNRKRRHFLKDVNNNPDDFNYDKTSSQYLNGIDENPFKILGQDD